MAFWRTSDPEREAAQRTAEQFVAESRPSCSVTSARLRATEPARFVFAVFYREPQQMVVPGRYALVAVLRSGGGASELEATPDSPYWIRGLK